MHLRKTSSKRDLKSTHQETINQITCFLIIREPNLSGLRWDGLVCL